MVGRSADGTDPAAAQAVHQHLIVYIQIDDGVQIRKGRQGFRLFYRAGKAVQNVAVPAVIHGKALLDQRNNHVIRHQLTRIHEGFGLQAGFRLVCDGRTKHITGGNLRNIQLLTDDFRLSSFSRAGRAKKYNIHHDASFACSVSAATSSFRTIEVPEPMKAATARHSL